MAARVVDATGVYALVTNSNGAASLIVRKWDVRGNELWTRQLGALDVVGRGAFAAAPNCPFGMFRRDLKVNRSIHSWLRIAALMRLSFQRPNLELQTKRVLYFAAAISLRWRGRPPE